MGKCYIDSINDKFVLNGSNIAFNEFTKYANGKILTLDGVEIIDSTLLSRLTVSGGKLALDGILVNGLDLGNISANILPSADTMYNLGSTTRKYLRGYFGEVNTSTINLDSGSITYDGTNSLLKLGTDTIATREWVNSSAIPTLKTINGEVITGTGDITIVGGSGSGGQNTLPNYSTTETLTSERWIDGKPIYRKVINAGVFSAANTTTNVAHNITGVDQIWIDEGNSFLRNGINSVPLNQVYSSDNITRVYLTTTSIMLYTNADYSSYTTYVTICYTKTTDTASSPVTTIGGSGTPKKYFARIKNGTAMTLNRVQVSVNIPLNTFVKGDAELSNGTTGFIAPQDDVYTIDFTFKNNNILNVNTSNIYAYIYINGVLEQDIFQVNCNGTGERSINGSLSTRLNKNDVVTYKLAVWASDTTSALQIPVGSFIANIRN